MARRSPRRAGPFGPAGEPGPRDPAYDRGVLMQRSFTLAFALVSFVARLHAADVSPVADAAMAKDAAAVRALVSKGADINTPQGDGMTALHWAAKNGDASLAQMLLYAGANVRATTRLGGYTALHLASQAGATDVVKTLLAAGA